MAVGVLRVGSASDTEEEFGVGTSSRVLEFAAATVVGVALIWITNAMGWWWATAVVGLFIGALLAPGARKPLAAWLAGALGWLLPLVWQAHSAPIGRAASTISGMMGFGTSAGWIVWVLTGVFGALLCVCPAWFGSAVRSSFGD